MTQLEIAMYHDAFKNRYTCFDDDGFEYRIGQPFDHVCMRWLHVYPYSRISMSKALFVWDQLIQNGYMDKTYTGRQLINGSLVTKGE